MKIDVETITEVWHWRVNPILVGLCYHSVAVEVLKAHSAHSGTRLSGMVIHLFLTLEDTIEYISHLCSHRVSYDTLHTITSEIAVGSLGQLGYLIAVGSEVGCYVVAKITYAVTVAEV